MTSVWTTVLSLALALNLEPFRVGLVPLMLSRPRPFVQLAAFLGAGLAMAFSAGVLVLFVLDRSPLGGDRGDSARVQVAIGVLALLIAAVMAVWPTRAGGADRPPNAAMTRVRSILHRGASPWWAAAIGLGAGLPTVDYLAVLLVIGSSGATPGAQFGALAVFLLVGNTVVWLPLASLLVAPQRTVVWLGRFRDWIATRTRRDFAGLVAVLGAVLVVIGVSGL